MSRECQRGQILIPREKAENSRGKGENVPKWKIQSFSFKMCIKYRIIDIEKCGNAKR